jgi:hypothetical protein
MKRYLITIIYAVILASCSDEMDLAGKDGTYEFRQNENFFGISVQDGFELNLSSDSVRISTVRIESDENVIQRVKCEVKNGILYFYRDPEVKFPSNVPVKISVTKDSLKTLMLSSAKVQIVDTLRTNEISLVCRNKSVLTGRLDCNKIQAMINHSTVEIAGVSDTIQTLRMNVDNGSIVKLFDLKSHNAKVNISGGSRAEVAVYNEFEVAAKEKSIVHYKGTAIVRSLVSDDDSEIKEIKE